MSNCSNYSLLTVPFVDSLRLDLVLYLFDSYELLTSIHRSLKI